MQDIREVLTKDKFLQIMNELKNYIDYDQECMVAANNHNIQFSSVDTSSLGSTIVDLLDMIFGTYVEYGLGDISYFVYELDFGRSWKPGSFVDTDENGNKIDIDVSSAEKLWDYLTKDGEWGCLVVNK